MKIELSKQDIGICNIHLEKKPITEQDFFSREVAKALQEYSEMILKGKAGHLPAEKFRIREGITITVIGSVYEANGQQRVNATLKKWKSELKIDESRKINITAGDIVQISGTGSMTVRSIKRNKVVCNWFDEKNHLHRKAFKKDEVRVSK